MVVKIAVESVESVTLVLCDSRDYFATLVGKKTTVLKIAVDSVNLESCDSRDYVESSLLVKKTD